MNKIEQASIIMTKEEASEYISAKLFVLINAKEELLEELNDLNYQIDIEMKKLKSLECPLIRMKD